MITDADRLMMLGLARGMGSHWTHGDESSLDMAADAIDSLSDDQCRHLVITGAQLLAAAWRAMTKDIEDYNKFMDDLWKQWSDV